MSPTTREPWGAGWSEQDRRVIVQCLTWGAQHFAALEDEDLVALVRASGRVEAQAAVSDALARLADALALVDVRVLDHLVIAARQTVSFAERGLL